MSARRLRIRFKRAAKIDGIQLSSQKNERESALVQRIAQRDRDAIADLYRIYHARLFKFIFRLTHSYTAADELVNDIMLLVWQNASAFRGDSKVSTWIFGIAYRQAVRHCASRHSDTDGAAAAH